MWKKSMGSEQTDFSDFLLIISGLLIILGGITGRPILFLISFLFIFYFGLNFWYEKSIDKHFRLQNIKKTTRLFPNDETVLIINFENRSIFPLINGFLQFSLDDVVLIKKKTKKTALGHLELPLSIAGKGITSLSIPIKAKKRGVARIGQIQFQYAHLFKFHTVYLGYEPLFQQEIIIYPKPLTVKNLQTVFKMSPGIQQARISPFVNMEQLIGVRDYHSGDPFKHVNWKATAKQQKLQTNTFEKTVDQSLIIIVNLQNKAGSSQLILREKLERFLSYTTLLAQFATKEGYPYQIYMNTSHISSSERRHYQYENHQTNYMNTLEMLARIPEHPMIFSMTVLMGRLMKNLSQPKKVIIVGEIFPEMAELMNRSSVNHAYYQVLEENDVAVLRPYDVRRRQSYAN